VAPDADFSARRWGPIGQPNLALQIPNVERARPGRSACGSAAVGLSMPQILLAITPLSLKPDGQQEWVNDRQARRSPQKSRSYDFLGTKAVI
jgi:hypothetical protein